MSKGQKDSEKRVHPRVPMMVKVRDAQTGEEGEYFSREISCGGLFLESEKTFPKGKLLCLDFQIPGAGQAIKVNAEVVRVVKPGAGATPSGVGLKFLDMDARNESMVAEYVDKLESIRKKLSE